MKCFKKFVALFSVVLLVSALCLESASAAEVALPPDARPHTASTAQDIERSLGDYTIRHIKGDYSFSEKAGGYYYAYSDTSTTYKSTFANIVLPTGFNRAGVRNGYLSLGIKGVRNGIDLGICNQGSGWMPYSNDARQGTPSNPAFKTYSEWVAPSSAKSAMITAKPVNTTTVHMYVQFQDANGNNVGKPFDQDITVTAGNLESINGKIKCKFFRFASLVPIGSDNQGDGSYMTGAKFLNCQLYNGSNYVSWGIGTSTVVDCFLISPSHITMSYSGQNDTFNIRHNG